MPELHSAFAQRYQVGCVPADVEPCVTLQEIVGWDLLQIAAWRDSLPELRQRAGDALGVALPDRPSTCVAADGLELLSIAPLRFWCVAHTGDPRLARVADGVDHRVGCVTPLGHSQVRIRISGSASRRLLAQEIALDLDPAMFPPGSIARTAFHHAPAMLQCLDAAADQPIFDLYITRTFAASTWEYLLDLAEAHGYEILERATLSVG